MKTLRLFIILLLCVCLLSGCAADKLGAGEASAQGPSGEAVPPGETEKPFEIRTSGDYTIRTNGVEATITKYNGDVADLTIPDTIDGAAVTGIDEYAFDYCTFLTSVTIPKGVTSIRHEAFRLCESLSSILIPDSVTSIGDWTFHGCDALTNITISPENPYYMFDQGVLFSRDGKLLHTYLPTNSASTYTIPKSVTAIGDHAFSNCFSLTSVTIPESVTDIGEYAFSGCSSLTGVTIPSSVTTIGNWAFRQCESLASITIPESVTEIGDAAFIFCESLTNITVAPKNPYYMFHQGVLFSRDGKLLHTYLPRNPTSAYVIPNGVTVIAYGAFAYCSSLSSITIPDSVTEIREGAFVSCTSLTSITIPESVMEIGSSAFADCTSLTRITIPDSVTSIGEGAFSYCDALTIHTPANSVAHRYAEENGIPFQLD